MEVTAGSSHASSSPDDDERIHYSNSRFVRMI